MTASTFTVALNGVVQVSIEVQGLSDKLPGSIAAGLNRAAAEVRKQSVAKIVSQVRLPESYVSSKVGVNSPATPANLKVSISADKRGTNLFRYGATQLTTDTNWDLAKYLAVFGVSTARPPIRNKNGTVFAPQFQKRKGDSRRGIAPGRKAAGVRVNVKTPTVMRHVFMLPTMRNGQDSGKFILVQRRAAGSARLKALYGPSVDQMVIRIWGKDKRDIADKVEEYVMQQVKL